jgi:uncharacterized membrane protein
MADKERLDIISAAIAGLLKRQDALEARLARIEEYLAPAQALPSDGASPPPFPPPSETVEPQPPPFVDEPPSPAAEPVPEPIHVEAAIHAPPARTNAASAQFETEMGLRWVNRIGAFTLVLAVAFFFKLAVDNEWIGPAGRVILGVLAGCATLAAADLLWKRGHLVYAQGVSGMGIAILYLTFYASFAFYGLVPYAPAFVLLVCCTALACALALRYDAAIIATLGLLGGYSTPVLLSRGQDSPWMFFGYILLLDAAAVWLHRLRSWRQLSALSMAASAFLFQRWWDTYFAPEKRLAATAFVAAAYVLFVSVPSAWLFGIAQALATIAAAAIWRGDLDRAAVLLLAFPAAGMVLADCRNLNVVYRVALASSWLAYSILYSAVRAPVPVLPLFALATALYLLSYAWAPLRLFWRGASITAGDLAAAAGNTTAYFAVVYLLLETSYRGYLGLFSVALACVHLAFGILVYRTRDVDAPVRNAVLVYGALALTLLTLAVPIQFTGFRITMAWMLEAAALTWIGRRAGSPRFVDAALIIFFLGLLRLFAIDAWIYPDGHSYALVWNGRFLTFLVSAGALWFAAWSMRPERRALAPYLAGHFVCFAMLTQEVLAWARRVSEPESVWNAQSAALSILWALYAVALVTWGVLSRFALNRILGLCLMGVVVVKLYLNDVWQLRLVYRVTAFAVLGVLLLLMSFLYSRFRTAIGNWWRDDRPQT